MKRTAVEKDFWGRRCVGLRVVAGLYANLCFAAYGRRKPSMLFGRGKISLSRLHSISVETLASCFWNHSSKHVIADLASIFTCMFTFIASEELSISTIANSTFLRHMCAIPLYR